MTTDNIRLNIWTQLPQDQIKSIFTMQYKAAIERPEANEMNQERLILLNELFLAVDAQTQLEMVKTLEKNPITAIDEVEQGQVNEQLRQWRAEKLKAVESEELINSFKLVDWLKALLNPNLREKAIGYFRQNPEELLGLVDRSDEYDCSVVPFGSTNGLAYKKLKDFQSPQGLNEITTMSYLHESGNSNLNSKVALYQIFLLLMKTQQERQWVYDEVLRPRLREEFKTFGWWSSNPPMVSRIKGGFNTTATAHVKKDLWMTSLKKALHYATHAITTKQVATYKPNEIEQELVDVIAQEYVLALKNSANQESQKNNAFTAKWKRVLEEVGEKFWQEQPAFKELSEQEWKQLLSLGTYPEFCEKMGGSGTVQNCPDIAKFFLVSMSKQKPQYLLDWFADCPESLITAFLAEERNFYHSSSQNTTETKKSYAKFLENYPVQIVSNLVERVPSVKEQLIFSLKNFDDNVTQTYEPKFPRRKGTAVLHALYHEKGEHAQYYWQCCQQWEIDLTETQRLMKKHQKEIPEMFEYPPIRESVAAYERNWMEKKLRSEASPVSEVRTSPTKVRL